MPIGAGSFFLKNGRRVRNRITLSNFVLDGDFLGSDFTYTDTENNLLPVANNIEYSGVLEVGEVIEISFELDNPTSLQPGTHELKIYKSTNQQGSSETLVTTITASTNDGDIVTFSGYTIASGELGKYLLFQIVPKVNGGLNPEGEETRSYWTNTAVTS